MSSQKKKKKIDQWYRVITGGWEKKKVKDLIGVNLPVTNKHREHSSKQSI